MLKKVRLVHQTSWKNSENSGYNFRNFRAKTDSTNLMDKNSENVKILENSIFKKKLEL